MDGAEGGGVVVIDLSLSDKTNESTTLFQRDKLKHHRIKMERFPSFCEDETMAIADMLYIWEELSPSDCRPRKCKARLNEYAGEFYRKGVSAVDSEFNHIYEENRRIVLDNLIFQSPKSSGSFNVNSTIVEKNPNIPCTSCSMAAASNALRLFNTETKLRYAHAQRKTAQDRRWKNCLASNWKKHGVAYQGIP
uniref:Uncharacterized protein n=1 Tax=Timema cristinae TaxID=61476 RepID=A0A7R9D716_TIMCR|nr:unnamed protein product [Timema cristinae]